MWLQQWPISHVIQTDYNQCPVDNESVFTLLCHQKTMNWKDMALWFYQRQCMYLLPYYKSNQKEIQNEEIRSEHLCHSWWLMESQKFENVPIKDFSATLSNVLSTEKSPISNTSAAEQNQSAILWADTNTGEYFQLYFLPWNSYQYELLVHVYKPIIDGYMLQQSILTIILSKQVLPGSQVIPRLVSMVQSTQKLLAQYYLY